MDYNTLPELTESQILSMSDNEIRGLKPRGKKSAWIYFAIYNRSEVRQRFPNYNMTYVTKQLGIIWRYMNDAEKQHYANMAQKDKERWNTEIEIYNNILESRDTTAS